MQPASNTFLRSICRLLVILSKTLVGNRFRDEVAVQASEVQRLLSAVEVARGLKRQRLISP